MKKLLVLAVLMLLPALLSTCNTMQGLGQDISAGGHAIDRAASQ